MGTHIYHNLQAYRLSKGYSQESFAAKINLSVSQYGKIERGEIDIKVSRLLQIIKALNAKPEIIFGRALSFPFSNF